MLDMTDQLNTIIANLDIPSFVRLTTAVCYVLGMYIIVNNILDVRGATIIDTGDGPTVFGCIKNICIGSALIYIPSVISLSSQTVLGQSFPTSYVVDTQTVFQPLLTLVVQVCIFAGVLGVAKGVYLMGYGQKGPEDAHGPVVKGLVMIIAGALLINLHGFLDVMTATLGMTQDIL